VYNPYLVYHTHTNCQGIIAFFGLISVTAAVAGGLLFVFSGFQNDGSSAQMGGSFIGAYASYFLALYFTK
jgi:hypothetical protein